MNTACVKQVNPMLTCFAGNINVMRLHRGVETKNLKAASNENQNLKPQEKPMRIQLVIIAAISTAITLASPLHASSARSLSNSENNETSKRSNIASLSKGKTNESQICYSVSAVYKMALLGHGYFCVDANPTVIDSEIIISDNAESGDTLQKITLRLDGKAQDKLLVNFSINQYGFRGSASANCEINGEEINMQQSPKDSIAIQVRKSVPMLMRGY